MLHVKTREIWQGIQVLLQKIARYIPTDDKVVEIGAVTSNRDGTKTVDWKHGFSFLQREILVPLVKEIQLSATVFEET